MRCKYRKMWMELKKEMILRRYGQRRIDSADDVLLAMNQIEVKIDLVKENAPAGRPSKQGARLKDQVQDTAIGGKSQG